MDYKKFNAEVVLSKVEELIEAGKKRCIDDVCEELSIFDWYKDNLTVSNLEDMRRFLETAIENGFTGYVCFKVGATGYSNGMWAYKEESTNGYSPHGDAIYKSFTPAYTSWDMKIDGRWLSGSTGFKRKIDMLKALKARKEV